jgi:predicted DsbA family dithiol-disulfide isomerase
MPEREAREAGLSLHWPPRLPNTRRALAAAEWARRQQPRAFRQLHKDLFDAHFVLGEDLEDPAVIDRHASRSGIDLAALHAALADGSTAAAVMEAEMIGREYGVQGTPAWLLAQRLIAGLLRISSIQTGRGVDAVRPFANSGLPGVLRHGASPALPAEEAGRASRSGPAGSRRN